MKNILLYVIFSILVLYLLCRPLIMAEKKHAEKEQSSFDHTEHVAIPDAEWEIDKNILISHICDDSIFSKVEIISKLIPFASPETGLGGLHASIGKVIVSPTNGSQATFYNIEISHIELDENGKMEDIAYLEKCLVNNNHSSCRYGIGWYKSTGIMQEILKLTPLHGKNKQFNSGEKSDQNTGDSGWNKSETGYFIIDKDLYSKIESVLKLKKVSDKNLNNDNELPWAWLQILPATHSPAYINKNGVKAFKVDIYKSGKIIVYEVQKKGANINYEHIGLIEDNEIWNKLRLRVLENDRKRSANLNMKNRMK